MAITEAYCRVSGIFAFGCNKKFINLYFKEAIQADKVAAKFVPIQVTNSILAVCLD